MPQKGVESWSLANIPTTPPNPVTLLALCIFKEVFCWWFKSGILPLLKHSWGESQLAAMLAIYTGRGVAPEVNLRDHISHMPLPSANKAEPTLALKPKGDVTKSPKQGHQWPQKWTCVQQKIFKKNKKRFSWYDGEAQGIHTSFSSSDSMPIYN